MYDEVEYWGKRVSPNSNNIDSSTHIDYIKDQLIGCRKILDFGPGDGRIFPAYIHLDSVEGFDITDIRKAALLESADRFDFNFNLTVLSIVGDLPYSTKEFDAAVATEVLLHQQPKNINNVMLELSRVADKVVVITWYDPTVTHGKSSAGHCFRHDYHEICAHNDLKITNEIHINNQMYFVYGENI